jgi:hypothetical protein
MVRQPRWRKEGVEPDDPFPLANERCFSPGSRQHLPGLLSAVCVTSAAIALPVRDRVQAHGHERGTLPQRLVSTMPFKQVNSRTGSAVPVHLFDLRAYGRLELAGTDRSQSTPTAAVESNAHLAPRLRNSLAAGGSRHPHGQELFGHSDVSTTVIMSTDCGASRLGAGRVGRQWPIGPRSFRAACPGCVPRTRARLGLGPVCHPGSQPRARPRMRSAAGRRHERSNTSVSAGLRGRRLTVPMRSIIR